jgi:hypothetical protein
MFLSISNYAKKSNIFLPHYQQDTRTPKGHHHKLDFYRKAFPGSFVSANRPEIGKACAKENTKN